MIEYRQSLSHPIIEVSRCGKVRMTDTKEACAVNSNHSTSVLGPLVYFRKDKKIKQLGLRSLVYESFVKEQKLAKGEFVEAIDGNEDNCHASNLRRMTNYKDKPRADKYEHKQDKHDCWFSTDASIYC